MPFLFEQFPTSGYPLLLYYSVGLVGISLLLLNPFYAFLLSVLGLSAKNFHAAILTRTEWAGPFLNLADLFFWIGIAAGLAKIIRSAKVRAMPAFFWVLCGLLLVAVGQSLYLYGFETFVLRNLWSVAIFPVSFFLSANMAAGERQAKSIYWALFAGATLAALQHAVFLSGSAAAGVLAAHQLRTIAYISSGGMFLLVAALFSRPPEGGGWISKVYYLGLALMALSFVMSQTRQLYVSVSLVILVFLYLFRSKADFVKIFARFLFIAAAISVMFAYAYRDWSFSEIIGGRIATLGERDSVVESYSTRWMGMKTEFSMWENTLLVLGVGVAYPPEMTESYREGDVFAYLDTGALDHVAVTSYLAHYGLTGVLIYLGALPLFTFMRARGILASAPTPYAGKIALLGLAISLFDFFNMFGSMPNTTVAAHIPGVIYGAVWGLRYGGKS